jgi:uroporphyrinogen III methyltransferase/synthase
MTVIATGHRKDTASRRPLDWQRVGGLEATVSVLMGVRRLGEVADGLLAGGRSPETGAALVEWGTTPRQRVLVATLGTIVERARAEGFEPPSVLVVGDVVGLHDRLDWLGRRPLRGRRVLVAREVHGLDPVSGALERLGAEVLAVPSLGWSAAVEGEGAALRLELGLDALCVPSSSAADRLSEATDLGRVAEVLAGPCLCGDEATAARLREEGVAPSGLRVVAPERLVETLAEALGRR